jgi:hypothetical protein
MKKCYFGVLLLLTLSAYGQDNVNNNIAQSNQESSLKIYPNPAINDIVYIISTDSADKHVVIYDVFGEVVLMDRIKSKSLDISRLVAGVYVLQITENQNTWTRKLIVK